MPKKPTIPDDCMPRCENCCAGDFDKGERQGECHLLPMQWTYAGDGDIVARWNPAVRDGWCMHFKRKSH